MLRILFILLLLFPYNLPADIFDPIIIFSSYGDKNVIFMDRLTLRRIFTRQETRWSDGQTILVYIRQRNSKEHKIFLNNVLKMSLYRYQTALESFTYTGRSLDINEVSSDVEMMMKVDAHPGSIGYVNNHVVYNQKIVKVCDVIEKCS